MLEIEVKQPNFLPEPANDPLSWAKQSKVTEKWIRYVAPQLGLDPSQIVLAGALSNIIGDDANCFGEKGITSFDLKLGKLSKALLLTRLGWEIELPEVPLNIKQNLVNYLKLIRDLDFEIKESFDFAREFHNELVKSTERDIAKNRKLGEAIVYRKENWGKLKPYYDQFIMLSLNVTEAKTP